MHIFALTAFCQPCYRFAMTKNVIQFKPNRKGDKELAKYFRELADDVEAGRIKNLAMIVEDCEDDVYSTFIGKLSSVAGLASNLLHTIHTRWNES